jgi:hypothetical protein
MIVETIDRLVNFSINERSIPWPDAPDGVPIFGKAEDLVEEFVVDFDEFVSKQKSVYGYKAGMCIIHDFNMRSHIGKDHPKGIAADFHFYGINLFHTVMACLEWGFHKIFFYPEWNNPGVHVSWYPDLNYVLLGFGYYDDDGKLQIVTNTYNPQMVRNRLLEVA